MMGSAPYFALDESQTSQMKNSAWANKSPEKAIHGCRQLMQCSLLCLLRSLSPMLFLLEHLPLQALEEGPGFLAPHLSLLLAWNLRF